VSLFLLCDATALILWRSCDHPERRSSRAGGQTTCSARSCPGHRQEVERGRKWSAAGSGARQEVERGDATVGPW